MFGYSFGSRVIPKRIRDLKHLKTDPDRVYYWIRIGIEPHFFSWFWFGSSDPDIMPNPRQNRNQRRCGLWFPEHHCREDSWDMSQDPN